MTAEKRVVALASLVLCIAADCEQCQPIPEPRRGNVDRVADGLLVKGRDRHTFFVTANPEIQHLRVLDLTDERFQDGPNRYFPLSIPVGPETRRLATAPADDDLLFALDSTLAEVFVVRTPSAAGDPWVKVSTPIPTNNDPDDIAAVTNEDGGFEVFVSLPNDGAIEHITVDAKGRGTADALIALPDGAVPSELAVSPDETTLLACDQLGSGVHVVDLATMTWDRDLDVGGPQGALSIGVVDVGDGQAPVALVGRRDANEVWALRLFRPGFREDRYAVLGGTTVGSLPLATYVPDERDTKTVCCRALSSDSINRGEATSAWGAAALANGTILYVALAAKGEDDTRLVRVIDDDPEGLAEAEVELDENGGDNLFVPGPGDGGAALRPDPPQFRDVSDFGDPPFVEYVDADEILLLVWEGAFPGLTRVKVEVGDAGAFTASSVNVEARGARVGDLARFTFEEDQPGEDCSDTIEARVLSVSERDFTVAVAGDSESPRLSAADEACLTGNGDVRVTIHVQGAFAVSDHENRSLGRLALTPRSGAAPPDAELPLPGAIMTIRESAGGPPLPDSRLAVPLDPHLLPMGLDLADPTSAVQGSGGFGQAGYLPVVVTGAEMRFPDPADDTKVISSRRMIIGTGSSDVNGLNVVFSCDEAEVLPGLCDSYR